MRNLWTSRIDRTLAWCFYAIFFLVPLAMWPTTYELFEFNKMWTVFGFSLVILFLWTAKAAINKRFVLQRTPLDIPLALFVSAHIISYFVSIDPHTSWWGYYSRFNGGLLSILTYVFLYYAFASNLTTPVDAARKTLLSYKLLVVSFISGLIVAVWGFPSHFGYDPTCFLFRGELNVACWTEAFQPKARMFSTLGQPNWLATYLAILLPIALALGLNRANRIPESGEKKFLDRTKDFITDKNFAFSLLFFIFAFLFYIDTIWTDSQSGYLGLVAGLIVFIGLVKFQVFKTSRKRSFVKKFLTNLNIKSLAVIFLICIALALYLGTPIDRLNAFRIQSLLDRQAAAPAPTQQAVQEEAPPPAVELGGTDSGKIRLIVWRGAIDVFRANPLFGSGVETFAYAYYKYRPAEHNLTSEWDYLYNKAHNEYLNYLATTGAAGLGSYLLFIGWFLFTAVKSLYFKKGLEDNPERRLLAAALIGSFVAILVSNFFGFSVVIVNLFMFLIPILFFDLMNVLSDKKVFSFGTTPSLKAKDTISPGAATIILLAGLVMLYFEFVLLRFWLADKQYALGYNLNKVGEYIQASQPLINATQARPSEYLYQDELSVNYATLALLLAQQNDATQAAQFAQQAQQISDQVVNNHPNNVVFYKTRTRVFYALAQLDTKYLGEAIKSIERASELAPTDAKILYNKALLYDQKGERQKAINILEETVKLKPDYRDAYYAIALFYAQMAEEETNPAKTTEYKNKARENAEYIINKLGGKDDRQTQDLLNSL